MSNKGDDVVTTASTRCARLQRLKRSPTTYNQSVDHTRQAPPTDASTRLGSRHSRISSLIKDFRNGPPRPKQERERLQALRTQLLCTSDLSLSLRSSDTSRVQSKPAEGVQGTAAHTHHQDPGLELHADSLSSMSVQQTYSLNKRVTAGLKSRHLLLQQENLHQSCQTMHSGSEDILQAWRFNRYQGKHVLQSSLQTAPCSDQPAGLCTTAAHSATPAIRVPTACDTDCHTCLMAGQSPPMPPRSVRTGIPPVLAQPASHPMTPECLSCPAIKAQLQHFPRPQDADAASRVIHEAPSSAAAAAFSRVPGAVSAGLSVGSLGESSHADHASAMPPHAAPLRSVIPDTCKVQSTSADPQPVSTATDPPCTDQWAARALVTNLPPSTPPSAKTDVPAEPTAATAQDMEYLSAEGSAIRLPAGECRPADRQEPLPPQPSSIFGSPEASASEGKAASSADQDSIAASSVPAQSHFGQTFLHQQSKAGSPCRAREATDAESCLVEPPRYLQACVPRLGACASGSDRASFAIHAASAVMYETTVSAAQVQSPSLDWSSSSVLPTSSSSVPPPSPDADHEVAVPAASDRTSLPVIRPLLGASIAEMVPPEALVSDVMEVVSCVQGAPCDMSWLPAKTLAHQRQESSRTSLSSSLASLLGDTIAAALFTDEPLQTFPSCTQVSYQASAIQTQALTTSHCSEPTTAGECHQFRGSNDPNAAAQDPSESVLGATIGASVLPLLPLSTPDQLSDILHSQLSEANQQHASSSSAQGVADIALPQLPPNTLDQSSTAQHSGLVQSQLSKVSQHAASSQSAHSATVTVADGVTAGVTRSVSSGSRASHAAWQHHSYGGSGQTGKGALAGQNDKALGPEQGRDLVSADDGLADRSDAASACSQASTACSESSSTACPSSSSNSSSNSSSRSQEISGIACSEGQTSLAAPQAAVALGPSGNSATPGDCETAQLWTTAAEEGKQLPTTILSAVSKKAPLASAVSSESVDSSASEGVQSSKADISASDGVQSSLRTSSASQDVVQTSIADSSASDGVQSSLADSSVLHDAETSTLGGAAGAEQAQLPLSASTSGPEAVPKHAGLVAPIQAGHGDFRGSVQQEASPSASEAVVLGTSTWPPAQLTLLSIGARQGGEDSVRLGMAFIGSGVSTMPQVRAATAATAEVCDTQTQVVDTGMQTDASLPAGKLNIDTETSCGVPSCHVKAPAGTHTAESAPAQRVSDDCMASGDIDAEEMHTSKARGVASNPIKQLCMSHGNTTQRDGLCAQAEVQKPGKCDPVKYTSGHVESALTDSRQLQQARPALLDLVTACGGHDSLKDLVRADRHCLAYRNDPCLMSVVEQMSELVDI